MDFKDKWLLTLFLKMFINGKKYQRIIIKILKNKEKIKED